MHNPWELEGRLMLEDALIKLVTLNDLNALLHTGVLPKSAADQKDGFIHLSTGRQALETANIHYTEFDEIFALVIESNICDGTLKWEVAKKRHGEKFPHLYGDISRTAINSVFRLLKNQDGQFNAPIPWSDWNKTDNS